MGAYIISMLRLTTYVRIIMVFIIATFVHCGLFHCLTPTHGSFHQRSLCMCGCTKASIWWTLGSTTVMVQGKWSQAQKVGACMNVWSFLVYFLKDIQEYHTFHCNHLNIRLYCLDFESDFKLHRCGVSTLTLQSCQKQGDWCVLSSHCMLGENLIYVQVDTMAV